MSITINDPVLLQQLRDSNEFVLLESPDGEILGRFYVGNGRLPPGVNSPSAAEIDKLCLMPRTGRALSEILKDLNI